MDVAGLHQGFLRRMRRLGGVLLLRSRAGRIERKNATWEVEVSGGDIITAATVVNAAGAWGDEVAEIAGVARLGLTPCRRTAAIIDPAPFQVAGWPMVQSAAHEWYVRAEARAKLMVTPCDETPMHPHDVQPDELDVAIAIDRMQQALDIRRTAAWPLAGKIPFPDFSGASGRAATAFKPRPPLGNWWLT
jgi:D-arginine dehydrogenase